LYLGAPRSAAGRRRSRLPGAGVNIYGAPGRAAGQEVFHVHLHVLPRVAGDGIGLHFGSGYARFPPRGELDLLAAEIRRGLI
jgi:diadenosine tetraphosphate (Ap4A) HIT family hydrolase